MARKSSNVKDGRFPEGHVARAELEVLACLNQHGQATARELREAMHSYRPMAHGSILTLLTRLEAKGLVAKEKGPVGKAFVYHVTSRSEPVYRRVLRDLVQRVFGGSGVALVTSLFETKPPSRQEIEDLQALLEEHRRKSGKKSAT